MVGENGPLLEGWQVQPGRHCGEFCVDLTCRVCGDWVPEPVPGREPDVWLGEN